MGRKNVTLAVGVVLLIGLSGVYFALKSYNEKTEKEAAIEAAGDEILSIDVDSVTELEFTIGNEQVSFVLEDEMWKKADDKTFPVDEDALLLSLSQFTSLKAIRTLEDTEDSSEYGMDEPQKIIRMTDSDGAETFVTIGATNSGTGDDYVMLNNDDSVIYTIDAGVRTAFSDDLYDYAVSEEETETEARTEEQIETEAMTE